MRSSRADRHTDMQTDGQRETEDRLMAVPLRQCKETLSSMQCHDHTALQDIPGSSCSLILLSVSSDYFFLIFHTHTLAHTV